MSEGPIAIDLFCGAGGMSLGFEQAGFDVKVAVDFDEKNTATHKKNFPDCAVITQDITRITGTDIRKAGNLGNRQVAVVFGGPPCQGFSFIGKRQSTDPRNRMLLEFARIVGELEPAYFVVENVKGLLAGYGASTVRRFCLTMKRLGYDVVDPIRFLDASDYGVPQRRHRVFIIGYREGVPTPKYPEPTTPHEEQKITVWDAIKDLPDVDKHEQLINNHIYTGKLKKPSNYATRMRGEMRDFEYSRKPAKRAVVLTGNLRTEHSSETKKRFSATPQGDVEKISRFYRLSKNGLSNTLRAGTGPSSGSYTAPRPIHPVHSRCITVREAARLHSFPDWFEFHDTKWHGFRQVGNAVPPRLAFSVARSLLATMHAEAQQLVVPPYRVQT